MHLNGCQERYGERLAWVSECDMSDRNDTEKRLAEWHADNAQLEKSSACEDTHTHTHKTKCTGPNFGSRRGKKGALAEFHCEFFHGR